MIQGNKQYLSDRQPGQASSRGPQGTVASSGEACCLFASQHVPLRAKVARDSAKVRVTGSERRRRDLISTFSPQVKGPGRQKGRFLLASVRIDYRACLTAYLSRCWSDESDLRNVIVWPKESPMRNTWTSKARPLPGHGACGGPRNRYLGPCSDKPESGGSTSLPDGIISAIAPETGDPDPSVAGTVLQNVARLRGQ